MIDQRNFVSIRIWAHSIALISLAAVLVACAVPQAGASDEDKEKQDRNPLIGTMWDTSKAEQLNKSELARRFADARFILLGEKHDNPYHHQVQADLLDLAASNGRRPGVIWEMIPEGQRAVLRAYLDGDRATPEGMGQVLNWQESGWPEWSMYMPIAAVALSHNLTQYPGNLDRQVIRSLARDGFDGLADATSRSLAVNARWSETDARELTDDLVEGHCGFMPDGMIGPMSHVQRARDAVMAAGLLEADVGDGAVLIAGNGHVRADRGVPRYLEPEKRALSVGIIEAMPGKIEWQGYLGRPEEFDIVVFTEKVETPDRCEALRKRFGKQK